MNLTRRALIVSAVVAIAGLLGARPDSEEAKVHAINVREVAKRIVARERTFGIDENSTSSFLLIYEGFQQPSVSVYDRERSLQRYQEALAQAGPGAHVNINGATRAVSPEYTTATPAMTHNLKDYIAEVQAASPGLYMDLQDHKGGIIKDRVLANAGDKWVLNRRLKPEECARQTIGDAIRTLETHYDMDPHAMLFVIDRDSTVSLPEDGTATVRDLVLAILRKNGETHALPLLLQVLPLGIGYASSPEEQLNPVVVPEVHGWTILGVLDSKQRIREMRARTQPGTSGIYSIGTGQTGAVK